MGIIDGSPGGDDLVAESASVVVSFILGFTATRIRLRQPVLFTYDPVEEAGATEKVKNDGKPAARRLTVALKSVGYDATEIGGISAVMAPSHALVIPSEEQKKQGKHYSETLKQSQWQDILEKLDLGGSEHYAITGSYGGKRTKGMRDDVIGGTYLGRNRRISDTQVLHEAKQALFGMSWSNENGAYYGIVDDPDTKQGGFVASSVRRLITFDAEGGRWKSNEDYQGLIGGEGGKNFEAQHGSFEKHNLIKAWDGKNKVVGYCHGMTWAIQRAKEIGPWATPYELGVGAKTKKLASCMGCTSFMYATGYPPSAMHIGSAQSWAPLPPAGPDNPRGKDDLVKALNEAWAADMAGYLLLGSKILKTVGTNDGKYNRHAGRLHEKIKSLGNGKSFLQAANIYLDASTIHKLNDTARVNTVLKLR